MKQSLSENNQQSAGSNKKRIWITILVAVTVFFGAVGATIGVYSWLHPEVELFNWRHIIKKSEEGENLPLLTKQFSLLVMGVDEREDDIGRADTMFFFSIPSDGGKPLLISIPRDTMVWKKEVQEYERINTIYPVDGIDATVQMVQNLLGVPVDGYVKINLEGFIKLVDIMGGIQIVVDEDMDYDDPYQDLYIHLKAGDQKLDGQTSMEYVRFRGDALADIGRIARQQKFLKAVMEQALSVNNISKIPGMIRQGSTMIETNISLPKILTLANTIIHNGMTDFDTVTLPGDGLYYGEAAMYMLRLDEMYHMLAELMIPEDQETAYLKLLQQKWIADYQAIHDETLTWSALVWEETGMWMSKSQYSYWKASQGWYEQPWKPDSNEEEQPSDPPITEPEEPVIPPTPPGP